MPAGGIVAGVVKAKVPAVAATPPLRVEEVRGCPAVIPVAVGHVVTFAATRVSVPTVKKPVVAAKYVVLIFVAPEPVPPQVPLILPKPPSDRLPILRFCPAAMLAVADPVGAILRFPVTEVPAGNVFAPDPLRMR